MIDIILPSFNDIRILDTICSIKSYEERFNVKLFRILIIDGGSEPSLLKHISEFIGTTDLLDSKKDNGIFDALNRGINLSTSEYIWWIGSDDLLNLNTPIEYFNLLKSPSNSYDCFNFKNCYFRGNKLTRSSSLKFYKNIYYKYGIELSHFSTIWRREFIGDTRFDLSYRNAADLDFFYKMVILKKAKIYNIQEVLSFMREGGNSSKNLNARKNNYIEILNIYKKHLSSKIYFLSVFVRICFKVYTLLRFNILDNDINDFEITLKNVSK